MTCPWSSNKACRHVIVDGQRRTAIGLTLATDAKYLCFSVPRLSVPCTYTDSLIRMAAVCWSVCTTGKSGRTMRLQTDKN